MAKKKEFCIWDLSPLQLENWLEQRIKAQRGVTSKPIPKSGEKRVEFRRYEELPEAKKEA
jgi:hypothetical protein